ncbi:MAG: hypothetical protein JJU42_16020 [Rhodobacteraceae bacterium]|nr:hypothetical protein [Paracoccaceae bacterium]
MNRTSALNRPLFWRLGLHWPALLLCLGLGLAGLALNTARNAHLLARDGVQTQAQITDKRFRPGRYSLERPRLPRYRLHFTYQPADHPAITAQRSVSRRLFDQALLGGTLPLRYSSTDPYRLSLDPHRDRTGAALFGGLGLLAAMAALGTGAPRIRRAHSARRARRHGARCTARVTGLRKVHSLLPGPQRHALHWQDSTGQTGQSLPRPRSQLARYRRGRVIEVCIDPASGHAWWCEDL